MKKIKVFLRQWNGAPTRVKHQQTRPDWFSYEKCYRSIKSADNIDVTILLDGTIKDHHFEFDKEDKVIEFTGGSDWASFNRCLDAIESADLENTDVVYLVEDDYLHLKDARKILLEGIKMADYVSLYDHPDKYINAHQGGNPYIENGGEVTQVFKSDSCHWKLTNSTTMTFASTDDVIKRDKEILQKWTSGTYPEDFKMFIELRENDRSLITPLPGYSTHGETQWLSPFTDWSKV